MPGEQKRQGDLLIVEISALPERVDSVQDRVLAKGELTGHVHELSGGQVFRDLHGMLFFRADEPVTLSHDEHGPLHFDLGFYAVVRQREFFEDSERRVAD